MALKTKLELMLDAVATGKRGEITLDVRDGYSKAQKAVIEAAARARGLDASSDGKYILVRKLSGLKANNPKDPATMTASEINKALDKLDKERSAITDEFINTGRGHERPSDYLKLSDPLSLRARDNFDAYTAIRNEVERRYGPGAPSRLPKGFGPIKRFNGVTNPAPRVERLAAIARPWAELIAYAQHDVGRKYSGIPGHYAQWARGHKSELAHLNDQERNYIKLQFARAFRDEAQRLGKAKANPGSHSHEDYRDMAAALGARAHKAGLPLDEAFEQWYGRMAEAEGAGKLPPKEHLKGAAGGGYSMSKRRTGNPKSGPRAPKSIYKWVTSLQPGDQVHTPWGWREAIRVTEPDPNFYAVDFVDDNGMEHTVRFSAGANRTNQTQVLAKLTNPKGGLRSGSEAVVIGKAEVLVGQNLVRIPTGTSVTVQELGKAKKGEESERKAKIWFVHNRTGATGWVYLDALAPAHSKMNPQPESDAMYESFHGRAPGELVDVTTQIHVHHNLASLGSLIGFKLRTLSPAPMDATIEFSDVFLCSNEDGTQLYLQAGDQSLDLGSLGLDNSTDKESIAIGEVWALAYHTRKSFDKFRPTDYVHSLGPAKYTRKPPARADLWEDATPPDDRAFGTGQLPILRYSVPDQLLYLDGGIYKIPKPLIGTSPGIVD